MSSRDLTDDARCIGAQDKLWLVHMVSQDRLCLLDDAYMWFLSWKQVSGQDVPCSMIVLELIIIGLPRRGRKLLSSWCHCWNWSRGPTGRNGLRGCSSSERHMDLMA